MATDAIDQATNKYNNIFLLLRPIGIYPYTVEPVSRLLARSSPLKKKNTHTHNGRRIMLFVVDPYEPYC